MASSSNHIALANKNQLALNTLVQDASRHPEWVATIAFYKAIHVIEAACRNLGLKHPYNHKSRLELLRVKNELKPIYRHFKALYVASCIARYLHDHDSKTDFSSFVDYISASDVHRDLVQNRLKNVEDALLAHLSDIDRTTLSRAM